MQKLSLKDKYIKEVKPSLIKEFDIKNVHAAPEVTKVVVNIGIGTISKDKAKLAQLKEDVAQITGQAGSIRNAKTSIAGFGVREGQPVGLKVTLRRERMYDFLARLFAIVLPRFRDFRGVHDKFDQAGNYTLGLAEHSVFPEIDIAKSGSHGIEITIVVNSGSPEKSKRLLALLGMPFVKVEEEGAKARG